MDNTHEIEVHMRAHCLDKLKTYVEEASSLVVFGDESVDFYSDWTLRHGDNGRPHCTLTFHFSYLTDGLADFARAYISHRRADNKMKPHAGTEYMRVFTVLSQAMDDLGCMSIVDLNSAVLDHVQSILENKGYSNGTMHYKCNILQRLCRELVSFGILVREFDWTHPYRPSTSHDVFSQEAREREKGLLPDKNSLEALHNLRPLIEAEFRNGSDKARVDLIIYWIIVIIFATGLRANEIISLFHNFLFKREVFDEHGKGGIVYFVRRKTSKGGPSDARPLSPLAASLCRKAQKYLMILTRPARNVLESYVKTGEVSPDWRAIKNFRINKSKARILLGLSSRKATIPLENLFKSNAVDQSIDISILCDYLNYEQEKFIAGRNRDEICTKYFPIMTYWIGGSAPKLALRVARFITYIDVRNFLAGNSTTSPSAFFRYLGKEFYLASHQLRRLMDTSVREGGISENELAILQGRANPAQSAVYDYRTPDERARDVREAVRRGETFGWVGEAYWSLPLSEREDFLDSFVQVSYRTPMGHCVTNIDEVPCPYHLQCLSGCGDYLHVKGDQIALNGLKNQQEWGKNTLKQLDVAAVSNANLADGVQNHRSHVSKQLRTIDKVMEIENDPSVSPGSTVRVYPNNESLSKGGAA